MIITASADTGEATVVTATASATVTPSTFADVTVFKAADKATVTSGETLTYTFTLMNTGFEDPTAYWCTPSGPVCS